MRDDVQTNMSTMQRDMQALRHHFDPSSLMDVDPAQQDTVPNTLAIPGVIREELERLFALHTDRDFDDDGGPLLREMADAFVRNFDTAAPLYESNEVRVEEAGGTQKQYIALLTCQFLVAKMLASDELLQAPPVSH